MPEFNPDGELKFQFLPAKPENGVKYLVATKHTQGAVRRDFCFCDEGEPVIPPIDINYPYMEGMVNRRGTTTVMVKGGFVKENLIQQTFNVLRTERFNHFNPMAISDLEIVKLCSDEADKIVDLIIEIARPYQIQTVLSVAGDNVFPVRALADFGREGATTVLDALCNVNKMINGMDKVIYSGKLPESVSALFEEIQDEINRVLPPNPYT